MKRFAFAFAFGIASLAAARPAAAQLLGAQGDAILSAERIFGVRGEHVFIDQPAPQDDTEADATTISMGFANHLVPYNMPRVAFDYMIIDKLSIGGAILYSTTDIDFEGGGDDSQTDFELAPRVGYLHMFGRVVGIWPRGGLTYHSTSDEGDYDEWTLALTAECMFPIVIREHFGALVGLTFDQALLGNRDPDDDPDQDISYRSIGLQVGLFGWI